MDAGCKLEVYKEVYYSMGAKYIDIELKTKYIQFFRAFHKDKRIGFIEGDITKLETMPQGQFDIIFYIEILPYI